MFKIGDKVKYVKPRMGLNYLNRFHKLGEVFTIGVPPRAGARPGTWALSDELHGVRIADENGNKTVYGDCFELVSDAKTGIAPEHFSECKITFLSDKPPVQIKPCTCDSLELFRKGCGCGAIAKQKWGLQG